jgi:hypothetical protein
MREHEYLRWCPAARCERVIECHVLGARLNHIVPTVQCECGNAFCFGCALRGRAGQSMRASVSFGLCAHTRSRVGGRGGAAVRLRTICRRRVRWPSGG